MLIMHVDRTILLTTHSPCSVLLTVCISRFEESCGRKYGPFPPLYPPKPHPHPVSDFLRQVIQTFCPKPS